MQVCSLPPAWGYQHQGLERFILSFPAMPGRHGSGLRCASRLVRQEADGALWRQARRREDHWAFAFGLIKLARAIRVGQYHLSWPVVTRPAASPAGACRNVVFLCIFQQEVHPVMLHPVEKDVRRVVQSEGLHKLALRAAMLPFPGFGDHFPCEYEIALRQELQLSLS